jgi:four helix bundle protein
MSSHNELKLRTKKFALAVINLTHSLPPGKTGDVIGKQLLRSATSVGANYRSACRARSNADFISKITIVEEEADESMYWLELLGEAGIFDEVKIAGLRKEADELTAIFTAAGRTAKKRQ